MLFERFEDAGLAHYSYAVGCPGAGKIAIIDPKRDIDTYVEFAQVHDVEIAYILETHIHADYASGAKELARRSGAALWVSGYDKDEVFEMDFPHHNMFEGHAIDIGVVRIEVRHTPGHTPEHLSFLVYDGTRSKDVPMLMLTGDFLFVGSLGRPDLLGDEAKRTLAYKLFHSVREKLKDLPDGLEVHPAHGAGSMCGSGMSGRPYSTLGFERIANPYLDEQLSETDFVDQILSTVPPFPEYYKRMKRINAAGPLLLNGLPGIKGMDGAAFHRLMTNEHVVIDVRSPQAYGAGHIDGSFGIGAGQALSTWASWVVPYDIPILLVGPDEENIDSVVRSLVRVGLDTIKGYLKGGLDAWMEAGYPIKKTATLSPDAFYRLLLDDSSISIIDVRNDKEWADGHFSEALHIMGGELPNRLSEVPTYKGSVACLCGSGYRSTVACSVLERAGIEGLINVAGGMQAWEAAELPLDVKQKIATETVSTST